MQLSRTSAATVITKFESHVYTEPALKGLKGVSVWTPKSWSSSTYVTMFMKMWHFWWWNIFLQVKNLKLYEIGRPAPNFMSYKVHHLLFAITNEMPPRNSLVVPTDSATTHQLCLTEKKTRFGQQWFVSGKPLNSVSPSLTSFSPSLKSFCHEWYTLLSAWR